MNGNISEDNTEIISNYQCSLVNGEADIISYSEAKSRTSISILLDPEKKKIIKSMTMVHGKDIDHRYIFGHLNIAKLRGKGMIHHRENIKDSLIPIFDAENGMRIDLDVSGISSEEDNIMMFPDHFSWSIYNSDCFIVADVSASKPFELPVVVDVLGESRGYIVNYDAPMHNVSAYIIEKFTYSRRCDYTRYFSKEYDFDSVNFSRENGDAYTISYRYDEDGLVSSCIMEIKKSDDTISQELCKVSHTTDISNRKCTDTFYPVPYMDSIDGVLVSDFINDGNIYVMQDLAIYNDDGEIVTIARQVIKTTLEDYINNILDKKEENKDENIQEENH